jgi:phospholipid/cholesterol/gamma-HCH transport system substrate-binding protein
MRSRWNLPVTLVYVAVCAVVLAAIVVNVGVTWPWQHPYRVTAVFSDGNGILPHNEVYLDGVRVGRVDDVQAVGGQARVLMTIDDPRAVPLHGDSTAVVRQKNLLNETYIEVSRGSGGAGTMPAGGVIPVQRTLTPVVIDQVLAILDPQTRERLQLLLDGAGQGLDQRGADLNAEASSTDRLVGSLNGPAAELRIRRQQLQDVVLEVQRLYDTLAGQRDQVREELGTFNEVMGQLAAQEQQIGGTVRQADVLLQNLDALVAGEAPALRGTLQSLPAALASTVAFLDQSNRVLGGIYPYREQIHDVFPNLATSFADTDPNVTDPLSPDGRQHLWSLYAVSCFVDCSGSGSSARSSAEDGGGATGPGAPNATWAAAMGDAR